MIVVTPEDFKPDRPWNTPNNILSGRLFKKNLLASEAKAFARVFNDGAIAERSRNQGQWNHEWAIVLPYLKRKWKDRPNKLPRLPHTLVPEKHDDENGLTYHNSRCIQKAVLLLARGVDWQEVEMRLSEKPGIVGTLLKRFPAYANRCLEREVSQAKSIIKNASTLQFLQSVIPDEKGGGTHE